jgi:hypothetical protein
MVTNALVTADEVAPVSSTPMIVFPSNLPSTRAILASEVLLALNRTRGYLERGGGAVKAKIGVLVDRGLNGNFPL